MNHIISILLFSSVISLSASEESAVDIAKRVIADQSSAYTPGMNLTISSGSNDPKDIELAVAAKKSNEVLRLYMLGDAVPEKIRITYAITVLSRKRVTNEDFRMSLSSFGTIDVQKKDGYLRDGLILAARLTETWIQTGSARNELKSGSGAD